MFWLNVFVTGGSIVQFNMYAKKIGRNLAQSGFQQLSNQIMMKNCLSLFISIWHSYNNRLFKIKSSYA